MYLPMLILILVVAFALILIVMVQNPKGGGLSSTFGGNANTIGGVQNTNTFLDRATWTLAISLFALILLSNFMIDGTKVNGVSDEDKTIQLGNELGNTIPKTDIPAPAVPVKQEQAPKQEEPKK